MRKGRDLPAHGQEDLRLAGRVHQVIVGIVVRIGLTLNEAIERVKAEVEPIPEVKEFIAFIQSSERGITR